MRASKPSSLSSESRSREHFAQRVGAQERQRLRGQRRRHRSVWLGLGVVGLVGWSIATPPLVGAFAGAWLDHRWPAPFSWTLSLLLLGLAFGCANAWLWINRERREMFDDGEEEQDV